MDFSRIETMFSDNYTTDAAKISADAKVTSSNTETFPPSDSPTIRQEARSDQLVKEKSTNHSLNYCFRLYPETTKTKRSLDADVYPETVDIDYELDDDDDPTEEKVGCVSIFGTPIVSMYVEGSERLCLAQISNTILRNFSYNEIHNRRVALGITCVQCSPSQLEVLRRAGAMPMSSRRCGLITRRESERLVKSFIEEVPPPRLPEDFSFNVVHDCGWGSKGLFYPSRYNSSRAKCIKCIYCEAFFSPNKFIFHYHKLEESSYQQPDAANFNSWRRHLNLDDANSSESLKHTWEDVKAMFNGGCRRRISTPPRETQYSSQPVVNTEKTRVCLSYSNTMQSTAPKYLPFTPSTGKTHPAFPNRLFGPITSYGDILHTLSLPYSMWTAGNTSSLTCNPIEPMTFNHFHAQNCLPINTCTPVPSLQWSPSRHSASSDQTGLENNILNYKCLDNKIAESTPCTDTCTRKWKEASTQEQVKDIRADGDVNISSAATKDHQVSTVPSKEVKQNEMKPDSKDKESDMTKEKEKTIKNKDTDETIFLNNWSDMSEEQLRKAIEEESTRKAEADKDYKRIRNMLRLRALKELELREEYARQLSSIKENILTEIEEERKTKTGVEDELKETLRLLQGLSQQMQVTS